MIEPDELLPAIGPLTVPPNAIEVLERVRNSYRGLSKPGQLTAADRAVLAAVKMTLRHLVRAC
jgi:hypothetical protein